MIFISYCIAGVFAFDKEKKLLKHAIFPKDAKTIAEKLDKLKKGEVIEELEEVLKSVKDKNIVTDIRFEREGFNIEFRERLEVAEELRKNLRELMIKFGLAKDFLEANKLISEVQLIRTREKLKEEKGKDRIAMQAVSCVADLIDITNRLSERLHEWYGFYYPELETKVKDNKKYAETIASNPVREEMKGFEGSIGLDLNEKDLKILKELAERTRDLFELREAVEDYLEELMHEVAPNVTALVGATLAARLLVLAGGLENLAKLPSSTIQLLGAEKALFRFMRSKKKSRPPKYGILFLHPAVINAPKNLRGRVARAVASEVSMAAKTDFYRKGDKSEFYKERLKKRISQILKK